jgi:hypothetical protein
MQIFIHFPQQKVNYFDEKFSSMVCA